MAPVSTDDGNMSIDDIDDATWATLSAVLTGNTYGLPDRVVELSATCGRFGIPLIEDAAHALETDIDGQPMLRGTAKSWSESLTCDVVTTGGACGVSAGGGQGPGGTMEVLTLTVVCHERRPPADDIFLHPATRDGPGNLSATA